MGLIMMLVAPFMAVLSPLMAAEGFFGAAFSSISDVIGLWANYFG